MSYLTPKKVVSLDAYNALQHLPFKPGSRVRLKRPGMSKPLITDIRHVVLGINAVRYVLINGLICEGKELTLLEKRKKHGTR